MFTYLKRQIEWCNGCLAKIQAVNNKQTVHKLHKHGYLSKVLYVDLVGPFNENEHGEKYILTMQDGFSKYACAHPIKSKEAEVVANQLIASWLTKFGCPVTIHTDMGTEFENQIWHVLCDRLQIQKTHTPPYNPQSNIAERFYQTLN